MKKLISICTALMICCFATFAQNNTSAKAKSILDQVSKKTKSYSTITLTYSLVHTSPEGANDKTQGKMLLKGDKYQLTIFDNILYSDGTTLYTYMTDVKEVMISNVADNESGLLNPANVLTMYEKGFKYKFIQDRFEQNRAIYVIDLYPENVDKSEYSKVRLSIDKDKSQLWRAEYFAKDGNNYTITVNTFKVNETIPESAFSFNKSEHTGVKVIDER